MSTDTLEELGRRLEVCDDLDGVVRTMKALAAVNVRQYERAARSLEAYYRTVELGLHVVLRNLPPATRTRPRHARGAAAVVIGSDHGLCGRFNEDLLAYARARLAEATDNRPVERLVVVGARIAALLETETAALEGTLPTPASTARITGTVRQLLVKLETWHTEAPQRPVYLLHMKPTSGSRYHPIGTKLLPVDLEQFRRLEAAPWPSRSLPTFTMESGRLLASLIRQYFFVRVFQAVAESLAAENASRLAAMQAAEKNLGERHDELLGRLRRQRQDAITTELLDVVSGYEALTSPR